MAIWTRLSEQGQGDAVDQCSLIDRSVAITARSPCDVLVRVSAREIGVEMPLLALWRHGFHEAVCDVIDRIRIDAIDACALADFCMAYGAFSKLAHLLEQSAAARAYVLAMSVADEGGAAERPMIFWCDLPVDLNVRKSRDMVRTIVARLAAEDALRQLRP